MGIVDDLHGSANKPPRPRFRTRGLLTDISAGNITVDQTCSSGTVTTDYGVAAKIGELTSTWDMVTPDYARRSARGEIISNPFKTIKEFHTTTGNFFQVRYTVPTCTSPVKNATVDFFGPQAYWRLVDDVNVKTVKVSNLVSDSDIKSATAVAGTQAWDKSNSHDADVLIDVAEFGKTLKMLRDPIQLSSTFLKKIQLGKRGIKSLSHQDAIAYANGLWLQYRYGIRPLVSSVNGVVKALLKSYKPRRQTYRGSFRLKSVSQVTSTLYAGTVVPFDYGIDYSDEVSIRTGLLLEDHVTFTQSLGVDTSGLLALPWELVPFSFVADWFVNVGTFLGSVAPFLTKTPLSSWTTTKRVQTAVFTVLGHATPDPAVMTVLRSPDETRSAVIETITRQPRLLVPSLTWKPRAIESISKDLRLVDSFALLHQQFLKVFKP